MAGDLRRMMNSSSSSASSSASASEDERPVAVGIIGVEPSSSSSNRPHLDHVEGEQEGESEGGDVLVMEGRRIIPSLFLGSSFRKVHLLGTFSMY